MRVYVVLESWEYEGSAIVGAEGDALFFTGPEREVAVGFATEEEAVAFVERLEAAAPRRRSRDLSVVACDVLGP